MAQWLRVYTALAKDPGLFYSIHIGQFLLPVTPAPGPLTPSSGFQRDGHHVHKPTFSHTQIHITKNNP